MEQDSKKDNPAPRAELEEIALDGTRYALLRHQGEDWLMGAVNPLWREELAPLAAPDLEPASLRERGIWLARARKAEPLAVMCCGLGAAWPGMGRGLYENFPAAREAMDEVAAIAGWDVLALMDETDAEKINRTRWQIPYLFLLEYAQWRQFSSLGLRPALMAGHSLGELIALCLAGVYSMEAAWTLLDVRASHMEELEARASQETGMLAVPNADEAAIREVLQAWPGLRITNRNTRAQYILGGPRAQLMEARQALRRRRIPAMMLKMNLAFHNPAMAVLRDISLRRLNGLKMLPAKIPVISCVNSDFYPGSRPEICRRIADLDENTVDWVASVETMTAKHGIRLFLELGPRETMTGITRETAPGAVSLACCRPEHEVKAMREACATLFSLGQITFQGIASARAARGGERPMESQPAESQRPARDTLAGLDRKEAAALMDLMARICRRDPASLRPDMDLRHDLALPSSRFPLLLREAEEMLGRSISLDNIFQIATVGDMVRFLMGAGEAPALPASPPPPRSFIFQRPPLARWRLEGGEALLSLVDPAARGATLPRGACMILCVFDPVLLPQIWLGLAPLGGRVALPRPALDRCGAMIREGATVIPLECGLEPAPEELLSALENLAREEGAPAGMLFAAPPAGEGWRDIFAAAAAFMTASGKREERQLLLALRRFQPGKNQETEESAWREFRKALEPAGKNFRSLFWVDERVNPALENLDYIGDLMGLEILRGSGRHILWKPWSGREPYALFCPSSRAFAAIHPDRDLLPAPRAGLWRWERQFSLLSEPGISTRRSFASLTASEASAFAGAPMLVDSAPLAAMLEAAGMSSPWLSLLGGADFHIFNGMALPPGVTRECRLAVQGKPWRFQDYTMTRPAQADFSVREISANGRHRPTWIPVAEAEIWLGAPTELPPFPAIVRKSPEKALKASLEAFREAPGLENSPLISLEFLGACAWSDSDRELPCYQGELSIMAPRIARRRDWRYKNISLMLEGVFHAAALAMALDCGEPAASPEKLAAALAKWRLANIGLMRLAPESMNAPVNPGLLLRRSWRDERLARFDARLEDQGGSVLLALRHLEFFLIDGAS